MLWAQLTAALFMTVPKKLCPLADGSLAEAARGVGGGDIASRRGAVPADEISLAAVWCEHPDTHFYMWEAHTRHSALPE